MGRLQRRAAQRHCGSCEMISEVLLDVATNLCANGLFVTILLAVGWISLRIRRRQTLLRFFGVDHSKRLVIYLSNLRIRPGKDGGAVGVDGVIRSYRGSTVTLEELTVAQKIRDLFTYGLPSPEKPGLFEKLLLADVEVQIARSPSNHRDLESSSSFITLGSPGYNVASAYIEQLPSAQTKFTHDNFAVDVKGIPPVGDPARGFIERIVDTAQNRCLFYVAGVAEIGTTGAGYFLASEWRKLHRKYGNSKSFVVMLRFDPQDYRKSQIVFERESSAGTLDMPSLQYIIDFIDSRPESGAAVDDDLFDASGTDSAAQPNDQ
jgi:hypothetical protein